MSPGKKSSLSKFLPSFLTLLLLAFLANRLTFFVNQPFEKQVIEYPLTAALLGLLATFFMRRAKAAEALGTAFRTEFFLKTGLVLLGTAVDFRQILSVGSRGVLQAALVVTSIFFLTWFLGGLFRIEKKLRAVLASAVSICGVSAAIAAAGAVMAQGSELAYATTLVILTALPLMVLQPYAAKLMGLPNAVAGAWIGGNIDTTAAVVGAGTLHSEEALKVASVVKMSQNALIGLAAFLLALYWVVVIERKPEERPKAIEIWRRFPKFILGFIAASVLATMGLLSKEELSTLGNLRNWFLTMAFVSIGFGLSFGNLKAMGARPLLVFLLATVANTFLALGVAWLLFR